MLAPLTGAEPQVPEVPGNATSIDKHSSVRAADKSETDDRLPVGPVRLSMRTTAGHYSKCY